MWTETTQQQYRRDGLRYASDARCVRLDTIMIIIKLPYSHSIIPATSCSPM